MSSRQKNHQRRPAKGRDRAGHGDALPGFAPFVNRSAGPAASGVRVGFPAERTVSLTYVSVQSSYQAAAGVINKLQFRLNSVFDPDYTNAGHQPMGFDQWAAFYNHYVVESATYDVEMSTREAQNAHVGTYLSDDPTIALDPSELIELGGTCAIHEAYAAVPHLFKGHVDIGRFMNRTAIASDPELRALVTANPADTVYLTCWFQATSSTLQVTLDLLAKLTFRVRFMEPKDLAPSLRLPRALLSAASECPSPSSKPYDPVAYDDDELYVRVKRPASAEKPRSVVRMPAV